MIDYKKFNFFYGLQREFLNNLRQGSSSFHLSLKNIENRVYELLLLK